VDLSQFITNENNQSVNIDGEYGAQCWDLVELYAEQVLQVPKEPWAITLGPLGAAYEAWTVFDTHMQQYFDKILAGEQQSGDICVDEAHIGGPEGHIYIYVSPTEVFEQNANPDGSPSHLFNRPTTYLLGSLRRKGEIMQPTQQQIVDAFAKFNSTPSSEQLAYYVAKTIDVLYSDLINGDCPTADVVNQLFEKYQGHAPNAEQIVYYPTKVLSVLYGDIAVASTTPAPIDKASVLAYIQSNLT
jgi:hypothetical protein